MAPVPKPKHERAHHFLREWRVHSGKRSQVAVADYLGVDQSTVSKVERGLSPYDQDLLERLSILYGCEPSDLLTVNPLDTRDQIKLVYSSLRAAPKPVQERAVAILEALLKAG